MAHRILCAMFRAFDDMCQAHGLRYWCSGGTLVGAIRHQGMVPWDGDVDVGMPVEDFLIFQTLTCPPTMALFDTQYPGLKKLRDLFSQYTRDANGKDHNGLQLDIFLYNRKGDMWTAIEPWVDQYKEGSFHTDDLFPLTRSPFDSFWVNVPHNVEGLSQHIFGGYPPPVPPPHQQITHEGPILLHPAAYCRQRFAALYTPDAEAMYESRKCIRNAHA
jgi:phosphorylcholine metabolism protein LicD